MFNPFAVFFGIDQYFCEILETLKNVFSNIEIVKN